MLFERLAKLGKIGNWVPPALLSAALASTISGKRCLFLEACFGIVPRSRGFAPPHARTKKFDFS